MYIILLFFIDRNDIYDCMYKTFFRETIRIKFVSDYLYKTFCLTLTMNI